MVRVKVVKTESINDPDGNEGRRVELVEERAYPKSPIVPASEEARVMSEVAKTMQQMLPPQFKFDMANPRISMPRLVLFILDDEVETLGIDFNVNQVYDLEMKDNKISFMRVR
jgi:hypothetical protein